MNEADVRAELNGIIDPCSAVAGAPAGIDEMGLIRELRVIDGPGGAEVVVVIGVTEPGCMMGASFVSRAREVLEADERVASAEVRLDHAMDWTTSDLDPAYAARLEAVRAENRALMEQRSAENDLHAMHQK